MGGMESGDDGGGDEGCGDEQACPGRTDGGEQVLCLFNMGAEPAVFEQPGLTGEPVSLPGLIQAKAASGRVELAPYGVAFIRRP